MCRVTCPEWSANRSLSTSRLIRHRLPLATSLFTLLADGDSDVAVLQLPACGRAQCESRPVGLQAYSSASRSRSHRATGRPAKLVKKLEAWKTKSDKSCGLVFPTAGCNPKLDFLDCLKTCAERAKLEPQNFWLHKFRATFATRCLWAGVDLRTVQQWLGHSDMESTMRYLKPSRSQQTRER